MILKFVLLIVGVVLILFLMTRFARNTNEEDSRKKPAEKVPNDRIVIIKGANIYEVKQAVQQFCNLYNSQELSTVVSVAEQPVGDIIITFPYNIDFGRFCFFINYMYYPKTPFFKTDLKGWTTTKENDMWVTKEFIAKKVMVFIPDDNREYDSLYLTTEDNVGYKIAFADSGDIQVLNPPKMDFEPLRLGLNEIKVDEAAEIS